MKFLLPPLVLLMGLTIAVTSSFANEEKDKKDKKEIKELQKKIRALKSIKSEKLDLLEAKEAKRWEKRYEENAQAKIWADENRALDSRFSQLAGQLTRFQDELQGAKARTEDLEMQYEVVDKRAEQFDLTAGQVIEKRQASLAEDIPLMVNERTQLLNKAASAVASDKMKDRDAIFAFEIYFTEMLQRHQLGLTQKLETRSAINPAKQEVDVWHIQMGSMLIADVQKNGPFVQSLMKTGALKGKVWSWRSKLSLQYNQALKEAATQIAAGNNQVLLPIDILQAKDKGVGFAKMEDQGLSQAVSAWFDKGGLVMYPLIGCALFAFILGFERFSTYQTRGSRLITTRKHLMPLIRSGKWDEAIDYSNSRGTGLGKALAVVVQKRELNRDSAEKSVKEALLTEIPNLEKRLGLISALGAVAPLLGLLGTVSGMIALFKVITDVGTNDARLLAGGISEALVTTQTGLIIAIPILLLHGFLSEKLDGIIANLNAVTMEALNIVWSGDEDKRQELLKGKTK